MFDPTVSATLRLKLASGQALPVIWLALGSVALAESAARAKPAAIVFDLQHGLWQRRDLEAAIGLLPKDTPALVRVAANTATAIGEALDAGAEGVIVPLVETARQARRAVRAAHYPPHGIRSGGGVRPLQNFTGYFARARERTVVAVMIETERGVANARAIAATPGVDLVFIGTGDLMISLGSFPNFDLPVIDAIAEVHRACRRAYVPCGIFTPNADVAAMRKGHGYRMVVVANDIELANAGFDSAIKRFVDNPAAAPEPAPARALPTLAPKR